MIKMAAQQQAFTSDRTEGVGMRSPRRWRTASTTALLSCSALLGSLGLSAPAFAQTAPSDLTTGYRWDAQRRLVGTISPAAVGTMAPFMATRYTYDADGLPIKTEKGTLSTWQATNVLPANWAGFTALETVTVSYDAAGNKLDERLTTAAGGGAVQTATQTSYDANDRPLCVVTRMNMAAVPTVGSNACALGTTGSFGQDRITKNIYDAAGQLVQIRKAVATSLEQAHVTYSFTNNGKQEYVIDANGNRASLLYDGFDRQTHWYFPSTTKPTAFNPADHATALATAGANSTTDFEQYGYDLNGNRTSQKKRDGQIIGYSYDALDRMASKDLPGTAADVTYAYDLVGHQLSALFTTGGTGVTNSYDKADRLASSTNSTGGTSRTISFQYDANGNRTRITHPDTAVFFTYDYDNLNRVTAIRDNAATVLVSITYDSLGRRDLLTRANATSTDYAYDAGSRLQSLTQDLPNTASDVALTFAYNPASQIVTRGLSNDSYVFNDNVAINRPYATNGLNQYSAAGGITFGYDANGNLTANGSTTYSYDAENRLTGASGTTCDTCTGAASLSYDPLGRLHQTSAGTSATTTNFLYADDALIAEYSSTGTLIRRYVHGPSVDEPMLWYEGTALTDRRFLYANDQGSIVAQSGAATSIAAYDPYGIPTLASAGIGRFQYTGQIFIPELGLYHYKARAYAPTLGRFMQIDPVGYDDQINLYAYVANDPVNETDPTGMCPQCFSALGGAVLGAGIDYGVQVLGNLAEGEDLGTALTDVNVGSIVISAGIGAVAGATGSGAGALLGKVAKADVKAARAERAAARAREGVRGSQSQTRRAAQAAKAQRAAKSSRSTVRRTVVAVAGLKAAEKAAKEAEKKREQQKEEAPKPPEPPKPEEIK